MQVGVSTSCYYPCPTEEALDLLLASGVRMLEVFFNTHSELDPHYIGELRRRIDAAGAKVAAIHPYTSGMEGLFFFTDYDRRFADFREYYKRYYEAAARLGAGLVVFHGAFRLQNITVEAYADRMEMLDRDASAFGVALSQENVERNLSRDPAFLRRLRELRPSQKFVLDFKQAVRAQADVYEMIRAMAGGIAHLHLSDHDSCHDCLPPGEGCTDFARVLRCLRDTGFDGTAVVELYRQDFAEQAQLDRSLLLLNRLLASVE